MIITDNVQPQPRAIIINKIIIRIIKVIIIIIIITISMIMTSLLRYALKKILLAP